MTTTLRALGVLLACLAAVTLTACGGGGPAAKIGEISIDSYVALGDGYAAAPYSGPTQPARGCLRSANGYPALLAEQLGAKDFVNATCLHARTQDLTRATEPVRGDEGTVLAQLDFVKPDTDLVTLTIGISDRAFARRIFDICASPCDEEEEADRVPTDELSGDLQRIAASVIQAINDITDRAPEARVVVVGYPTLLPAEGHCDAMPEMDQDRADLVNAVLQQLNKVLQTAANRNGADFVDTAELSAGHDMCADSPWVQGAVDRPNKPPRFHPLAPLGKVVATRLADDLQP